MEFYLPSFVTIYVIQLSYLSYVGIQKRYFPNYNLLNILFPIYPIQAFDDQ